MKLTYDPDIFDAIEFGYLESIKTYWQDDIDIDHQEKGGNSMLMLADSYGQEDIVEFLISKNPDLYLTNDLGQTAEDIAKVQGHTRIRKLIRHEA